jgi:hypothetical protein
MHSLTVSITLRFCDLRMNLPNAPCRVTEVDARAGLLTVEYHGARLTVDCQLLGDVGRYHGPALYQFLGELSVEASNRVSYSTHSLSLSASPFSRAAC